MPSFPTSEIVRAMLHGEPAAARVRALFAEQPPRGTTQALQGIRYRQGLGLLQLTPDELEASRRRLGRPVLGQTWWDHPITGRGVNEGWIYRASRVRGETDPRTPWRVVLWTGGLVQHARDLGDHASLDEVRRLVVEDLAAAMFRPSSWRSDGTE